jgi:hypothetical protein
VSAALEKRLTKLSSGQRVADAGGALKYLLEQISAK